MKILHYTVGFSKNRGGGLTKYVDDLVAYQSRNNSIIILYPGEYSLINENVSIKKEKSENNISIYSIVNPLSLPMMFGLKDKNYLTKKTPRSIWKYFLKRNKVDCIHLHTLMGLYEEFIDAAKELNIPIVYTTHDYFGLCPKQTYIYNNKICDNWSSCIDCSDCNKHAFSKIKIFLIHSRIFCKLRKNTLFLKMKSWAKSKIEQGGSKKNVNSKDDILFYRELKNKYINIFTKIDWFHFNSSISEFVFKRELPFIKGSVINISHKDIKDHRIEKDFNSEKLRITYLGPATSTKGFDFLIQSLDKIYLNNHEFILNIYTHTMIKRDYFKKNGYRYNYSQLSEIMKETDILIAPSIWYETFGFTVLEALSYGVPVVVSDCLGAKDLVRDGENGYVINKKNIESILLNIIVNKDILKKMNHNICVDSFMTFEQQCHEICLIYQDVCKKKREHNDTQNVDRRNEGI